MQTSHIILTMVQSSNNLLVSQFFQGKVDSVKRLADNNIRLYRDKTRELNDLKVSFQENKNLIDVVQAKNASMDSEIANLKVD